MISDKSTLQSYLVSLLSNFWLLPLLLLVLLVAFRKTIHLGQRSVNIGVDDWIRVMTTAEPLRSPYTTTNSNGIIPHDNNNNVVVEQVSQPFDSSIFRSYL